MKRSGGPDEYVLQQNGAADVNEYRSKSGNAVLGVENVAPHVIVIAAAQTTENSRSEQATETTHLGRKSDYEYIW